MAYSQVIASTVSGLQFNDLGQPGAAYRTLASSLDSMHGFDELQLSSPHLVQLARALAARGEEAESLQVAHELLALCADHDYNSRYTAYSLLAVCNSLSHSAAAELLNRIVTALETLDRDGTVDQVPSRSAARHEAWGAVASFQQQPNRAIESYRRAIEAWQTIDRPYDQARALAKLGQVLALRGVEEEASIAFTRANERIEVLAEQLDDVETKTIFLQSPLVRAIQNGLQTPDS